MPEVVHDELINERIFTPSRRDALLCLKNFCDMATDYAKGRNYDRSANQSVSQLSPYIRYRLITEREVIQHVLNYHDYPVVEKFIQEVSWRTYFKGYLEMRSGIWDRFREDAINLKDMADADLNNRFSRAVSGETGIECFDAWTDELVTNGWLHNHVRMWYASIWIFTLELPWQLGAAFFLEHLLDGDPASNTLSWRWVGGLHSKGKHYLARASNIRRFTEGRFNPVGQLNENASALVDDNVFETQPFESVTSLKDINFPSLSCCPAGLLVAPDDLSPESGELSETPFSSLCVFSGDDVLNTYNASPKVREFLSEAVDDAGERLSRHWDGKVIDCRGEVVHMVGRAGPDNVGRRERLRVYSGTVKNWTESIVTWARNENLNSVWMMRPPAGPWADAMPGLRMALRQRGIRLFEYRRRWDTLHWPHATAGYFRFKKGLQDRVQQALIRTDASS